MQQPQRTRNIKATREEDKWNEMGSPVNRKTAHKADRKTGKLRMLFVLFISLWFYISGDPIIIDPTAEQENLYGEK